MAWITTLALDRKTKRLTLDHFGGGISNICQYFQLPHVAQWYRIHLMMQETQETWAGILGSEGWQRGVNKAISQNLSSAWGAV